MPFESEHERRLGLEETLAALTTDGLITDNQSQSLLERLRVTPPPDQHPLQTIADQGFRSATTPPYPLTLERLTNWLAETCKLPYLRIDPLKLDVESVTGAVSQAYASRFEFLPVEVNASELKVATAQPFLREWQPEIERVLKRKVSVCIANPRDVARYLSEFYGVSRSISGAVSKSGDPLYSAQNFEQLTELGKVGEPDANDSHIVHIVDWLLQYAFEQRASDIHIEPRRDEGNIRFRIDGVLHLVHQLPAPIITAISSRLKSLGRMDVADKRRPQDGRIRTKTPAGEEVELRLSTMPTTFGEKLVMRIFDPSVLSRSYEELGFSPHDLQAWRSMTENPHGIILVTGPTGSGKTTTLYSTLKQLARPEINVCTIEDPIEMVEPQFNQMQVQHQIDLDFASGVRTLMRQDPDIIMVGEIRDKETAGVAIQAALTGHLVLSTLHTNDAPSAITRLMDIGVPAYLIAATVLGVVAQRLIRTLCPHCKKPGKIEPDVWAALTARTDMTMPPVFEPVGCEECRRTGYLGRSGLYEILTLDRDTRAVIEPGVSPAQLTEAALKNGMRQLRVAGAIKVASGTTSVEEVFNVIPPGGSNE